MTFFFSWVGGSPIPAFTLATTADVWGGSITVSGSSWVGELNTAGDIMATGVLVDDGQSIKNLRVKDGLVIGQTYYIEAPGMRPGTTFLFTNEEDGGHLNPPAQVAENLSVRIFSGTNGLGFSFGSDIVHLDDISSLVVGTQYGIRGRGISSSDTFFVFNGTHDIQISNPAIATGADTEFTVTLDSGRNVLTNLGSREGLEVGEVYQIFGKGVTEGVLGVFQEDGTMLLSQPASESFKQSFFRIHRGIVYPDGGPFIESEHARNDETVLTVRISQAEGEFASLDIDIKNPRIGLLAPGRNVWCWLSWRETDSDPIIPLFHGRLEAIPTNIIGEKVSFHFIAAPGDYDNQRNLLLQTLKELPYFDPIWFDNGIASPDTILEARPEVWDTNRVTLQVSTTNIVSGEDGTLEVEASEHLYPSMNIKFGTTPLTGMYVTGNVTWAQEGTGSVDLTRAIVSAFKDAGSNDPFPHISAYCGDGLLSTWPKPGASIGAGWTVGFNTTIVKTNLFGNTAAESRFVAGDEGAIIGAFTAGGGGGGGLGGFGGGITFTGYAAKFPLDHFQVQFTADYQAKRDWTENVSFFIEADIQEINTDSRSHSEILALSSSIVSSPIDFDGFTPLRDSRSNSYFKTERGQLSFQFLLAYARAKLLFRARAVTIEMELTKFSKGLGISCRQNVHLIDYRLPGGQATGKVVAYELIASASGGMRAKISFGCSIGRGGSVEAAESVGGYAAPGYMAPGYQSMKSGTVSFGDNTIAYQTFSDFKINDDGVNLFDLTDRSVVKRLKVVGGIRDQLAAIAATRNALTNPGILRSRNGLVIGEAVKPSIPPNPTEALKNAYPEVLLELVELTGGGFISELVVDVSKLQIPKTIDLEAPSNA